MTRRTVVETNGRQVLAWAAIVAAGCATGCVTLFPGGPSEEAEAADRIVLVQGLHREARLRSGELDKDAVLRLADAVVEKVAETNMTLDAWGAFVGPGRLVRVFAVPKAGAAARAVAQRLREAAPRGTNIDLVEGLAPPTRGRARAVVVVIEPEWRDGRMEPEFGALLEWQERLHPAPLLFVADLLEPRFDGVPWNADELLACEEPRAVVLATRYILQAHAAGAIPDIGPLAAALGVPVGRLDWIRLAVAK